MNASELQLGKPYECVINGGLGIAKTYLVPLAINAAKTRRFIIMEARPLHALKPALFRSLVAMSFDEIVDEDLDGGPDRKWSSHVCNVAIDERGDLYMEDSDAYFADFVETHWDEKPKFDLGRKYSRKHIKAELGGSDIDYLPFEAGRVVCGCFTLEHNPEAPDIVIPGNGPVIQRMAHVFCEQDHPVPIFIKRRPNEWEYVGDYQVERFSTTSEDIAAHHKGSITKLNEVTRVIYLRQSRA
jgi:hypothetical protein